MVGEESKMEYAKAGIDWKKKTFKRWAKRYKLIGDVYQVSYLKGDDYMKTVNSKCVWTEISGDNGRNTIVPGYWSVNRVNTYVTELPYGYYPDDNISYVCQERSE